MERTSVPTHVSLDRRRVRRCKCAEKERENGFVWGHSVAEREARKCKINRAQGKFDASSLVKKDFLSEFERNKKNMEGTMFQLDVKKNNNITLQSRSFVKRLPLLEATSSSGPTQSRVNTLRRFLHSAWEGSVYGVLEDGRSGRFLIISSRK